MRRRVRLDPDFAAPVLGRLPPATKRRLREALRALAHDPDGRDRGLDVKELVSADPGTPAFRLRVGDWRVALLVEGLEIRVLRIFHRREGYGWMERQDRQD